MAATKTHAVGKQAVRIQLEYFPVVNLFEEYHMLRILLQYLHVLEFKLKIRCGGVAFALCMGFLS